MLVSDNLFPNMVFSSKDSYIISKQEKTMIGNEEIGKGNHAKCFWIKEIIIPDNPSHIVLHLESWVNFRYVEDYRG